LPSWMRCATIAGCLPWASRGSLIVTSRPLVPALVRVRDLVQSSRRCPLRSGN
jgi:hypothetical protein